MAVFTTPSRRTCGFRFSVTDALVLLLATGVTFAFWPYGGSALLVVPVALGHFFLFCNVFRIHRNLELIWAATFLLNVGGWMAAGWFSWIPVLMTQTPITITLITLEMRSPRYHGVMCRRINSRDIDRYLHGEV